MIDMSLRQILEVWNELEDALQDNNKYGGNTAEIYAYRLLSARDDFYDKLSPGETRDERERDAGLKAIRNLKELAELFEEMRDAEVRFWVSRVHDGYPLSEKLLEQPFTHRIHVRVYARDPNECPTCRKDTMGDVPSWNTGRICRKHDAPWVRCPKCGHGHNRGPVNGVDAYRCLHCGETWTLAIPKSEATP